jgi:uncharacterized protein
MKIVNLVSYVNDADLVSAIRPEHREYMDQLLDTGKLVAGGPYHDGSGALFIYETASLEEADRIVSADPYSQRGAIANYTLEEWQVIKAAPALLPDPGTRVAASA